MTIPEGSYRACFFHPDHVHVRRIAVSLNVQACLPLGIMKFAHLPAGSPAAPLFVLLSITCYYVSGAKHEGQKKAESRVELKVRESNGSSQMRCQR